MAYTKTTFVSGVGPAIDSVELNKLGQGIEDVDRKPWIPTLASNVDLTMVNEGQIWKVAGYEPPEFNMKIGSDKYYIDLDSLLKKYPSTGVNKYTGILYQNNLTPIGRTVEIGPQGTGNTNSVTFGSSSFTMAYYIEANRSANAYTRVSFGIFDISIVRSIKVTFRVVSKTGNESSEDFGIYCAPQDNSSSVGSLSSSNYSIPNVGSSYETATFDVSRFLGWAEVYVYAGTAYSSASFANGMTVEVSKVELVPM